MPDEIPESFDCLASAAVLRSSGSLAIIGHLAFVVSLAATWNAAPANWIKWCSVVVWCFLSYLSIRAKIDAKLFELLATHPASQLDRWLGAAGLRKHIPHKTIADRRRGALRIWRYLITALILQIALMLAGLLR